MKNKLAKTNGNGILTMHDFLGMLSTQAKILSANKPPSAEQLRSALALTKTCAQVNTFIGRALAYAKMVGGKPNVRMLGLLEEASEKAAKVLEAASK